MVVNVQWKELERTVEKFSEILENNLDRSGLDMTFFLIIHESCSS